MDGGFEGELLALEQLSVAEFGVVLLEAEHTEGHVAGLVAHHVPQQLLEQWVGGDHVHGAKRCQGQTLNHDLHAQVRHVPAAVADDVVKQHAQMGVERVVASELGVEVLGEHLHVAGLVHDLGGGVVLGVDPRHGLNDLGRADEGALLAMHELAEAPVLHLHVHLDPLG